MKEYQWLLEKDALEKRRPQNTPHQESKRGADQVSSSTPIPIPMFLIVCAGTSDDKE